MSDEFCGISPEVLDEAALIIRQGGVVAFPTETYYGLAADPFNEEALRHIFELKKRPTKKPLLTLVEGRESLSRLTDRIDPLYEPIMEAFWPGPVTLLFTAKTNISPLLTGNTEFIGVRISSHPVARKMCQMVGGPITATSANLSGGEAATSAHDVLRQLGTGVDMVIDGGKTPGGKGSTIINADQGVMRCVREGVIPFLAILDVL